MMISAGVGVVTYLFIGTTTASMIYFYCFWLGISTGYWAMFVTVGAEQFGTNLRATAATTIPNMVRGTVVIMNFLYIGFKSGNFEAFGVNIATISPKGVIISAAIVGLLSFGIGIYSTLTVPETHGKDLDYLEI